MPYIIFYIFVFIFGAVVGSFLNCAVCRLETAENQNKSQKKKNSFFSGRSFCPKCKHALAWYDLIPIVSFLMLGRKCRYCSEKISFQYIIAEILTGLLFVLIFQYWNLKFSAQGGFVIGKDLAFGFGIWNLFYLLIVASLLIIIFIYDLKHYIIPDKIIFPAISLVFIYLFFESFGFRILDFPPKADLAFGIYEGLKIPLISAFFASFFFFLLWFASQGRWMGFGDVKLAFFMGLFLGFPNILVALFLAFFLGAIIGIGLIAMGKKKLKSEVPFGPFLIVGTFLALFWGREIIIWYLSLFS